MVYDMQNFQNGLLKRVLNAFCDIESFETTSKATYEFFRMYCQAHFKKILNLCKIYFFI